MRGGARPVADCRAADAGSNRQRSEPPDQGGSNHGAHAADFPRPDDRGNQLRIRRRPLRRVDPQPQFQGDGSGARQPAEPRSIHAGQGDQGPCALVSGAGARRRGFDDARYGRAAELGRSREPEADGFAGFRRTARRRRQRRLLGHSSEAQHHLQGHVLRQGRWIRRWNRGFHCEQRRRHRRGGRSGFEDRRRLAEVRTHADDPKREGLR